MVAQLFPRFSTTGLKDSRRPFASLLTEDAEARVLTQPSDERGGIDTCLK
jgi:hypothetical protein